MGLATTGGKETEESPEDTPKPYNDPERPHPTPGGGGEDQARTREDSGQTNGDKQQTLKDKPQTPDGGQTDGDKTQTQEDSGKTLEEATKPKKKASAESPSQSSQSVRGERGGACGYDEPGSSSGERRQLIPDSNQHRHEPPPGTEPAAPEEDDADTLLTQNVDSLLRKCGNNVQVLFDAILDQTTDEFHPASMHVRNAMEDQNGTAGSLETRPMLKLIQNCFRSYQCTSCSPLGRLTIRNISTSGSVMEGLCNTSGAFLNDSDVDTMYEFGPIQIETAASFERREPPLAAAQSPSAAPQPPSAAAQPPSAAPQPPSADAQPPPRLILTPTDIPGFVLLLQHRTPDCQHENALPFSALTFHKIMNASVRFEMSERSVASGSTGPSTELHWGCTAFDGNDVVPCFRTHWWPSEEFLSRPRAQDWPPAAAREDVVRYGVHLVAKSAPGAAADPNQWRISFSRAEVVASWHLTTKQRGSLLALKRCKKGLGERGKGVKSYFMKTSLFWLCQEIPSGEWHSAADGTQHILDFLESAVEARNLPCFFWTEINLFRFLSPQDMDAMKETIRLLRADMHRQLMRWCVGSLSHFVELVLKHPAQLVPERRLRVCLARAIIVYAVEHAARKPWNSQQMRRYSSHWTPRLLGSSATMELEAMHHRALGTTFLQMSLFRALLVAPTDVLMSTRLTELPSGMFTLDPTPLLSLLEEEDGLKLLVKPEQVFDWCRRQHQLPPAERPSEVPQHINTLRGFCDLVLQPALLQRALCESIAGYQTQWREEELHKQRSWRGFIDIADLVVVPDFKKFEQRLRDKYNGSVERRMQRALGVAGGIARGIAQMWWEELEQLFNDPVVGAAFRRTYRSLPDTWQLRQYVLSTPETSAATAPLPGDTGI